jgi:pimeloyl-ACP methyl ester carboxylesterase
MAWSRTGDGPKTVIAIPGGPGNAAPTLRPVGPALPTLLADGYTCWSVTRRRGMPVGSTVADMGDDFAALIADELGGRVDLVIGTSFGGMIGFYLAARHPGAIGRMAVVGAAARTTDEGKAGDMFFARALAEGRMGDASVAMLGVLAPQIPAWVARAMAPVLTRLAVGEMHPGFASDVVVEAEAADACDARDVLPTIEIPVLVVGCDRDRYFPLDAYEETARLIRRLPAHPPRRGPHAAPGKPLRGSRRHRVRALGPSGVDIGTDDIGTDVGCHVTRSAGTVADGRVTSRADRDAEARPAGCMDPHNSFPGTAVGTASPARIRRHAASIAAASSTPRLAPKCRATLAM